MKNIILMISGTIIGVLTLMIVMSVEGRMNRSMELQSSLSSAVEETVENALLKKKYSINNTNEFLADLVSELSVLLDTKSDITVDVLQCDKEKGILAVKVTASFLHPNGKPGTVTCERNVILNKLQESEELEYYKIQFFVGDVVYKAYDVLENDLIAEPVAPSSADSTFYGWVDKNGYLADFSQPVTQNLSYYADMK